MASRFDAAAFLAVAVLSGLALKRRSGVGAAAGSCAASETSAPEPVAAPATAAPPPPAAASTPACAAAAAAATAPVPAASETGRPFTPVDVLVVLRGGLGQPADLLVKALQTALQHSSVKQLQGAYLQIGAFEELCKLAGSADIPPPFRPIALHTIGNYAASDASHETIVASGLLAAVQARVSEAGRVRRRVAAGAAAGADTAPAAGAASASASAAISPEYDAASLDAAFRILLNMATTGAGAAKLAAHKGLLDALAQLAFKPDHPFAEFSLRVFHNVAVEESLRAAVAAALDPAALEMIAADAPPESSWRQRVGGILELLRTA